MSSLALPLVRGFDRLLAPVRALERVRVLTVVALASIYVVWGSTYLAIEVAVAVIPPLLLLSARFAIAGLVLLAWAHRRGRPAGPARITLRSWGRASVDGIVLLGLGTGLTVVAQTRLTSGMTALLAASVPVWLVLAARGMFGERLSGQVWLGSLIGLLGIGVLVDPGGGGDPVAMLMVLAGAAAWAIASVRSRETAASGGPILTAGLEMLAASVLFLIVGLVAGEHHRFELAAAGPSVWAAFAYLTIAGSVITFTAYRWLLGVASTTLVGTFAYVNPVVAVALGWLVLGEQLGARMLLGGVVVLVAVVLLVTGRPGQLMPAQVTSGGDVFAGASRWHRVRRRLGRLPGAARLYVDPHAPQYRSVGYPQEYDPSPEDTHA